MFVCVSVCIIIFLRIGLSIWSSCVRQILYGIKVFFFVFLLFGCHLKWFHFHYFQWDNSNRMHSTNTVITKGTGQFDDGLSELWTCIDINADCIIAHNIYFQLYLINDAVLHFLYLLRWPQQQQCARTLTQSVSLFQKKKKMRNSINYLLKSINYNNLCERNGSYGCRNIVFYAKLSVWMVEWLIETKWTGQWEALFHNKMVSTLWKSYKLSF